MKFLRLTLLLLVLVSTTFAAWSERKKSDPGPHPIRILKVVKDNPTGDFNTSRGEIQIWLQNGVDADVDKVRVEIDLYSKSGRFVEKLSKEVGVIKAGSKNYQNMKWNVYGESQVTMKIWIYYNGGLDRLTQYEAEPPVW